MRRSVVCVVAAALAGVVIVAGGPAGAAAQTQGSPPSAATLQQEGKRLLVVALDAVPFDVVERAMAESAAETPPGGRPLFAEMSAPTPVISSFPSTTTLAFTGMFEDLGLATPPGYEAKFFDLERGKVRGGGPISYHTIDFSWHDFFDFHVKGAVRKAWGYARPVKFAGREIRKGLRSFLRSDKPVFFFYMSSTDGIAHLKGPEDLVAVLYDLDVALQEARLEEDFYTVLLSDHGVGGGEPLLNVRKDVKRTLRADGFRTKKRLRQDQDLVLVPFGLLSSFVAFAEPGQETRVAELIGSVEGVSVCAAPSGEGQWSLAGSGGTGTLERRETEAGAEREPVIKATNGHDVVQPQTLHEGRSPGSGTQEAAEQTQTTRVSWRYDIENGDPLAGESLAGDWVSDPVWLEESSKGPLPDAPHRIARAFDLVLNTASVVCSLEPGYMFGSMLTEWSGRLTVGKLRWTHGALERDDSLGFLATDLPTWKSPAILRFDHVIQALRSGLP